MESRDDSTNRKPRSVKQLYRELKDVMSSLPEDRKKAADVVLQSATLAEDLRKAINDSGRTTYDIGRACGVSHGMIDRFIRGERDMRIATAGKICEELGYGLVKIDKPVVKKSGKKKS